MTGKLLRAVCAGAVLALAATGCASGGSPANTPAAVAAALPSFGPAEKTTLNVGAVPAMDSAGFFVALNQHLFAKEGLTINYAPAVSSETAVQQQLKGELDISAGNYVSYINEVAVDHEPLEVVAEGSIMTPGSQVIYTAAGSPIKTVGALKGRTIAVNAPNNIDYLLDVSVLSGYGISPSQVKFPAQPLNFPEIAPDVLAKGSQYAAATLPEPFASLAQQSDGMVPLVDLDQGAVESFPIEGYVVTKQWAKQNPNTLKRFLAALEEGQEIADTQRSAVENAFEDIRGPGGSTLPENAIPYGWVTSTIASVMALNTYPIGVDETRIQRVANVMHQFGLLKAPFNVSAMIMPTTQFDFSPFTKTGS
ncbi:MAG TPA: ABC transporter substrate-binding protein [Trebonia sp.]|jgi:NitT/TauT family transport system substrate-binding protein|nr:ABC transporter substrate-binding protein [Trebonia sp.]